MEITKSSSDVPSIDVKVRKIINDNTNMKAVLSITVEIGEFMLAVHDIKIVKLGNEGSDRYIVAMPSRRTWNGEFLDIVHPINKATRDILEKKALSAYFEYIESIEK